MALVFAAPEETRAHILRAAGRQYEQGDVQHWWHPPSGRGIRTRIADDPLWLPFAASYYAAVTGDASIFDESVPYLDGSPLKPGQADLYGLPARSSHSASLYDHCLRALERAERVGSHGLPLMDHGDWNDGMNRVGIGGKGESVWLAWFAVCCLDRFAEVARCARMRSEPLSSGSEPRSCEPRSRRTPGTESGTCRAFWDDGAALGSAHNTVCSIDSISQSWAVLAGAENIDRAQSAMSAVDERLVLPDSNLILLFTPPFEGDEPDPGYVKGYLPGVRENGGQYTHAATWCVAAFAQLGDARRTYELFSMINPIRLSHDPDAIARYRVEPYVVAGDVYSQPPHVGRGGWTWYTGSAGWCYRVVLESILGFKRHGARLDVGPCVPADWTEFEMIYRFGAATYEIKYENLGRVDSRDTSVRLDERPLPERSIPLVDDGKRHQVRITVQRHID